MFWLFAVLTLFPAWRLTGALFPSTGLSEAVLRAATIGFALIVLVGLLLGSLGLLGTVPYLTALAVASASAFAVRRRPEAEVSSSRLPVQIAMVMLPMLAFIVAVGLVQSPLTLYDSLSYHLVFPARWLQDHRLSIVPTPFSDPAQAYQPGNGELFFLWLMLPFHGDLLARIGQLPFLLLSRPRSLRHRPPHAAREPATRPTRRCSSFLARPVVEQAVGADVDLVCAATFLTSLYLGIVAIDTDARRDWALWGVSVGLYLGTKYLALVYLGPVLLVLPLLRGLRRKAFWALPGFALFGLPWYARNWIVAGSPIYPVSLQVLGIVVARGAFTREAMNNSVFHVTSLRLLPAIVAHAFGAATRPGLAAVRVPRARRLSSPAAGGGRRLRRGWFRSRSCPLFWFGVPGQRRLALSAAGGDRRDGAARRSRSAQRSTLERVPPRGVPDRAPCGSWWARRGRLPMIAALVHGRLALARRHRSRARRWPMFGAGAMMAAACVAYGASRRPAIAAAGHGRGVRRRLPRRSRSAPRRRMRADGSSLLTLSPTYIRAGMVAGWDWTHQPHRRRHDRQQPATTCPTRCSASTSRTVSVT